MRALAILLAAALVACPGLARRSDPNADLAKALAGRVAEPDRDCLPDPPDQARAVTYDGIGVLYGSGRRLYLNRFGGACPSLRSDRILVTRPFGGQFCRGDRVTVLDRGSSIPVRDCIAGRFTPYRKTP